ncbi:MAG: hypothetical protein HY455_03400 [Parcubacteria group bacterium]|nr:hypothetical protein [Parcubacteria group bacterium]
MRVLSAAILAPLLAFSLFVHEASAASASSETRAREFMRTVTAKQFGGVRETTWDQIGLIFSAREIGLEPTATLEDIGYSLFIAWDLRIEAASRVMDQMRTRVFEALVDGRHAEISPMLEEAMELERRGLAQVLGVPIGTPWTELNHRNISQAFDISIETVATMTPIKFGELHVEETRRETALGLDLPPDAPWSEIFRGLWASTVIGADPAGITWKNISEVFNAWREKQGVTP